MDTDRRQRLTEQRAAQGLPPYVEDQGVLRQVAAIVLGKPLPPAPAVDADTCELVKLHEEIRADRDELKSLRRTASETLVDHVVHTRKIYELECEVERLRALLEATPGASSDQTVTRGAT